MRRIFGGLVALSLLSGTALAQGQGGPPPLDFKAIGLTAELFGAIRSGDAGAVQAALDHGADINRRNWLEMTPLDFATMLKKTELIPVLLAKGAKVSESIYGSVVVSAAMMGLDDEATQFLAQGASANAKRPDKATTLMLAAAYGSPKVILQLKPDAQELAKQDIDGATALIYAARLGQVATTKALLAHQPKLDQTDSHGRTALMYAAMNGHKATVDLLLASGAKPGLTDTDKATALHLTARYSGSAEIAQSLVKAKAPLSGTDAFGKTPLALAQARQFSGVVKVLQSAGARRGTAIARATPQVAVQKSLVSFQSGMKRFLAQSECASCHHQGLGVAVLSRARYKGFKVDQAIIDDNLKRTEGNVKQFLPLAQLALANPAMAGVVPTSEMDEMAIASSYFFWAWDEAQVKPDTSTTGLAQYNATLQQPAGNWRFTLHRGPMQTSLHTATAFMLRGMRNHLTAPDRDARVGKAVAWLQSAPAPTPEDKASRLLGLHWAGWDTGKVQKEAGSLLAAQRPDGGFSAKAGAPSDPHTTGLALYSLRVAANLPISHPAVKKATNYLLRMQDESGAWFVNKTIQPFNYFFDTGFPGGESQYASFGASGWATLALMEVSETKVAKK